MRPDGLAWRGWLALVLVALPVLACGPDFPDRFLRQRSRVLRDAPRTDFARVLAARAPTAKRTPRDGLDEQGATLAADLADLLAHPGTAGLVAAYERSRAATMKKVEGPPLPPGLPREIALYAQGAAAFHAGDQAGARAKFTELMSLPAHARRTKSTWAEFMLGKLDDGEGAIAHLREVRLLARAGFDDRLRLAETSVSEWARIELARGGLTAAVDLYSTALAEGDPTATESLRVVAAAILRAPPDARSRALRHPRALELVAVHLAGVRSDRLERGGPARAALDAAVASLPQTGEIGGAAHLAWAAYRAGDADLARRLLARARPGTQLGDWLTAKLAARAGNRAEAARALGRVVSRLEAATPGDRDVREAPLEPESRARGELAILRLDAGALDAALSLLLDAGSWRDAAHVAERVMTVEELRRFVDAHASEAALASAPEDDARRALRGLLARRLVREGLASRAMRYLPSDDRPQLQRWLTLSRASRRGSRADRAEALSSLARLQRHRGMELSGTELAPDWHLDGGAFDEGASTLDGDRMIRRGERERYAASSPPVPGRFHYRRVAAETMRRSADLSDGDEAAARLCVARGWLVTREPRAATVYLDELRRRRLSIDACDGARARELARELP